VTDATPPLQSTDEIPPLQVTDAIPPLLMELGHTAREVASALLAEGITARRGATTFRNPIVRYINRHLQIGGYMSIPVGDELLTVVRDGNRGTIRLPMVVSTFLARFHAGEFPQLEQR
jgi:hypothetical protein